MGRSLKPCGTEAAYKRHLRAGERPCGACRAAHRAGERSRVSLEVAPLTLLPAAGESAQGEIVDRLEATRWALDVCTDAIKRGSPGLVGLLREHARLVDQVVALEAAAKPDTNPLRALLRSKGMT